MGEASPAGNLRGPRKAAILMVLLGDEVAGKLLRHLPRAQMARLAREVAELGPIDEQLAGRVLQEYFVEAVRSPQESGGVEVARRLLSRAAVPDDQHEEILGRRAGAVPKVVAPLLEATPSRLARALAQEHPQTIALVLVHLPPSRAAKVVRALPEEIRSDTLLRMTSLRQVRGDLLGEVAQTIREGLGALAPEETSDAVVNALDRTAAMLASMKRADARALLELIRAERPDQASELQVRVFTFDSLALADDRGIQELMREIEAKRIATALKGAPETVSRKFFANLSERAATMLRDEMEFLGAVRPEDCEEARREIVDLALKLEQDGRLVFTDVESEEDSDA